LNNAIGDIEFDNRNETIPAIEEHGARLAVHVRASQSSACGLQRSPLVP
jgi:hypothetical protein